MLQVLLVVVAFLCPSTSLVEESPLVTRYKREIRDLEKRAETTGIGVQKGLADARKLLEWVEEETVIIGPLDAVRRVVPPKGLGDENYARKMEWFQAEQREIQRRYETLTGSVQRLIDAVMYLDREVEHVNFTLNQKDKKGIERDERYGTIKAKQYRDARSKFLQKAKNNRDEELKLLQTQLQKLLTDEEKMILPFGNIRVFPILVIPGS